MEPELQQRIERTVLDVLEQSDMDNTTEYKVRKQAAERLDMDLSRPECKAFVRKVVESFLQQKNDQDQQAQEEEAEEEAEEDKRGKRSAGGKEYNDAGDLIICKLSAKRKVTLQDFRGRTLVSIREYYNKGTEELPTAKGISLTEEQWSTFKKNIPAIEKAIKKMESRA